MSDEYPLRNATAQPPEGTSASNQSVAPYAELARLTGACLERAASRLLEELRGGPCQGDDYLNQGGCCHDVHD